MDNDFPIPQPLPPLRAPPFALLLTLSAMAQHQALAQQQTPEPLALKPAKVIGKRSSTGVTNKADGPKPALLISAERLQSRIDQEASAEGDAELRYGELLLRADRLSYDQPTDLARATSSAGKPVELSSAGNIFRGPQVQLYVNRFEGEFLQPSYFFSQTGGGGRAERIVFHDERRASAFGGTYSSCPAEEGQEPAWQIRAERLDVDLDANEGVATGAVLRFLGVPILAAPTLSFPMSGQRKSGWLPANVSLDNRSGFELGVPYYWNIAPQRDATITPFIMTRRGAGVDSEFRYLEPNHDGRINLNLLPNDRVAGRSRYSLDLAQDGQLAHDWAYRVRAERVSDDDYWKDMPRRLQSKTPRLLGQDLNLLRRKELSWGELQTYLRVQQWQALQGLDTAAQFITPYQRSPQLGARMSTKADDAVLDGFTPWGRKARLEGALELEYNRFDLANDALPTQRTAGLVQGGQRMHVLGHVSLPMGGAAWWLIPRLAVNSAAYRLDQPIADGRTSMHRTIPTLSLDHGWIFERDTTLFGRALRQTLEPRLLYVNTPYRDQLNLPNFDSAAKDFNSDSIYTENQFTGVDRVSDAHQLTLGATSRWINPLQGEEVLRLGVVQRVQFRDQRITTDGVPQTQRLSDLLLLGSAHLNERWWADGTLQFNPDTNRSERVVARLRYSPGAFRTVSAAYRLARGQSEQLELAWQWPLFTRAMAKNDGKGCAGGSWYSAGRVQYSLHDRRLTDSVVGVEYDAGCWIMRVGAERLSTGRAETNTRLMLQLELVGLSQLGSNALKVLRDNVPGYRQLSSERSGTSRADSAALP